MDTQTLTQQLRDMIPESYEWKFALYNSRKSRDGLELDINSCKMQKIPDFIDTLKTNLLEKTLAERTVTEYSPFLPKENIGTLEKNSELIRNQIGEVLLNTKNALPYSPEDFLSGVLSSPKGYIFYGFQKDADSKLISQILLIKRSNPFITGSKARLCTTDMDKIVDAGKPLLKFTQTVDFLFINDYCYFISPAIEKDFGLESRHIAICAKRLTLIADAGVISNYDQFEAAAMKSARKFLEFDSGILDHIGRLSALDRAEFLSTYGITTDINGHMNTNDDEECELVIDLLCCRSCLDPLGRLATGSNITPR